MNEGGQNDDLNAITQQGRSFKADCAWRQEGHLKEEFPLSFAEDKRLADESYVPCGCRKDHLIPDDTKASIVVRVEDIHVQEDSTVVSDTDPDQINVVHTDKSRVTPPASREAIAADDRLKRARLIKLEVQIEWCGHASRLVDGIQVCPSDLLVSQETIGRLTMVDTAKEGDLLGSVSLRLGPLHNMVILVERQTADNTTESAPLTDDSLGWLRNVTLLSGLGHRKIRIEA
jgi:hypothetical protein